jgi:hypothetical protein
MAARSQKPAQPQPLNFTVQIASKINDNSFQVSDFHFQIGTLMSKDHAHEQKLLVLFRVPSSQKPPVTNSQQSTTGIYEKPQETTTKNHRKITQYSYRAYPPAKGPDNILKKVKS